MARIKIGALDEKMNLVQVWNVTSFSLYFVRKECDGVSCCVCSMWAPDSPVKERFVLQYIIIIWVSQQHPIWRVMLVLVFAAFDNDTHSEPGCHTYTLVQTTWPQRYFTSLFPVFSFFVSLSFPRFFSPSAAFSCDTSARGKPQSEPFFTLSALRLCRHSSCVTKEERHAGGVEKRKERKH